jgi:hypothetical protein
MIIYRLRIFALPALLLAITNAKASTCDPTTVNTTHQVDVTCYGAAPNTTTDSAPAINAAARVAAQLHVPLVLPAGRYVVNRTIDIDYAAAADTGIELKSDGAILDGTSITAARVLVIHCSGGTPASPKGCFYFHQTGTLFVYAHSNSWAVDIGNEDFSDAQNSIKLDHLIVNNAGPWGVALNFVLNADAFIVADAGPGGGGFHVGLGMTQVQFSTIRGAASAVNGWALWIGGGYTIANTIQGFDLEASQWCLVNTSPVSARNTFVSPYLDCLGGAYSEAGADNVLLNPLFGGATQIATSISAGFKVMQ